MTNPPHSPHHGLHHLQHLLHVGRLRLPAPPGHHLPPPPLPMQTMLLHVASGPSDSPTSHQHGRTWVGHKPNSNPPICVLAFLDHKRRSEGIMEPSAMCRPAGTLTNLSRDRVCPTAQVVPNCSLSEPHLKWDSLQFSCTISLCFICIEALSICKTKSTIHHKYQCSGCHKLRFSLWSPKLFESPPPPS